MLRGLAEAAFLFLLPFLGYVLLLLLQRRFPFMRNAWTRGPLSVMVVLGLALAVAGALLWGLFSPRHPRQLCAGPYRGRPARARTDRVRERKRLEGWRRLLPGTHDR